MKVAVYPGSFDPITNGHMDVLNRACNIVDKVIVLVAVNANKKERFSAEDRVAMIKEATKGNPQVEVYSYDGSTVDFVRAHNAKHIIRGLRAVTDFDYEFQLASAYDFADSTIDTVFLMAKSEKTFINSSMIVSMYDSGIDVSKLVPDSVIKYLKTRKN